MSGETARQESGWTVDTLKDHLESLRDADEKAVNAALTAAKEAVLKAEETAKETLKSHNDLIRQSRDRDSTYATKTDVAHLADGLRKVEAFQSRILGALGLIIVIFPLVTAAILYLFTRGMSSPGELPVEVPAVP